MARFRFACFQRDRVLRRGWRQLQVAPIPWDKEVHFRLPVKLWKEMMDTYYPASLALPGARRV